MHSPSQVEVVIRFFAGIEINGRRVHGVGWVGGCLGASRPEQGGAMDQSLPRVGWKRGDGDGPLLDPSFSMPA